MGEYQLEKRYLKEQVVWGGLALFICFLVQTETRDTKPNSQLLISLPYYALHTGHFLWLKSKI
jgi:hypothetical protein